MDDELHAPRKLEFVAAFTAITALAIGEKLGIYRDYPVSKGCTSPFAPIWIKEMVKRKG